MKIEDLKLGDKLRIKDSIYEVAKSRKDAEPAPDLKLRIRQIWVVELHQMDSKKLLPEDLLIKYKDTGKITFNNKKIKESDISKV